MYPTPLSTYVYMQDMHTFLEFMHILPFPSIFMVDRNIASDELMSNDTELKPTIYLF